MNPLVSHYCLVVVELKIVRPSHVTLTPVLVPCFGAKFHGHMPVRTHFKNGPQRVIEDFI